MRARRTAFLAVAAAVVLARGAAADDRVETRRGVVEGTTGANGVRSFKGIPFAEPPIGELRWKAPRPAKAWEGVRPAKAFGPAPVQERAVAATMGLFANFSEDCLYLNVWTPARAADEKLPVMVWIYGGAFSFGATSTPLYDGAKLAEKGVVVVSAAYRVGPLGFLAHPELTREAGGVSGNFGLRDQVAALEWVRDEIGAFGGDPGRVTIFGESAGGISVSMLAASPRAKGLFQRAIAQSGASFAPAKRANEGGQFVRPLAIAEAEGARFLQEIGAADLAAARALPATDLMKVSRWWWPVLDGDVLPGDAYERYQKGEFNDVPVLIGTNSDEGAMFLRRGIPGTTPESFEAVVRAGYGEKAGEILAAYPHADPEASFRAAKGLFRDTTFAWPAWAWANLQAGRGGSKAYVYYFDVRSPLFPDGATHASEIAYVFRNLAAGRLLGATDEVAAAATSDLMSACWVNFAKAGDPNAPGLPAWPAFDPADPKVLHIDAAPSARPVPNLPQLKALDAYYAWRRDQARALPAPAEQPAGANAGR